MHTVSSYPHSSNSLPSHPQKHRRYDIQRVPQAFFAPLLQWLLLLSIVLAVLLMAIFCTQPMTKQTLISDFWAGIDGISRLW